MPCGALRGNARGSQTVVLEEATSMKPSSSDRDPALDPPEASEADETTVPQAEPGRRRHLGLWLFAGAIALVGIAIAVSRSGSPSASSKAAAKNRAPAPVP